MNLIDGKKIAAELRNELKVEVDGIKKKFNKVPGLTVILIGDLAPSQIYVRNKEKSAKEIGLKSEIIKYLSPSVCLKPLYRSILRYLRVWMVILLRIG